MLDRFIKISSLSGAFLIFCGVLKLIIYYSSFNINIVEFLSFSEIITSFLDDINILLIYIATMLIVSFIAINAVHKKTKLKIDDAAIAFVNIIFPFKYRYVLFFAIVIVIISILISYDILSFNYYIIYLIIFCTIQFLSYLVMTKNENNEIDIPNFSLIVSIAVTITTSIFLLAKHDIQATTCYKHPMNISTEKLTIECNKKTKNIYLGKTDGYVFIKMDTSNSSISIPISEIKKFEFK